MTATLSFNRPEEEDELRTAIHAQSWKSIVVSWDQKLRGELKYKDHPDNVVEILNAIRKELHEDLERHNLSLD